MKVLDLLDHHTSCRIKKKQQRKFSDHKINKESLSFGEICHLMGMYRDTYKRGKGGAIRRK